MSDIPPSVVIRPLQEGDLAEADRIFRKAFGTFIGLPDPMQFTGDAAVVRSRFQAFPEAAFGAFLEDRLVGSVFASHWGSFAFFGPLSVEPELWEKGIAQRLMAPVMDCFRTWGATHTGLYTFPQSAKHLGLYHKFGFRPRCLTAIMGKALGGELSGEPGCKSWSGGSGAEDLLAGCRRVAQAIYPGLDLTREIEHLAGHGHGALVWTGSPENPEGFALCHRGQGSEAGSGACYVKFAGVLPGEGVLDRFQRLLASLEAYGRSQGAAMLLAGVNTGRVRAYEAMLQEGFRIQMTGVALQGQDGAGFSHSEAWVLDDWR
ncbi:MAG: hypothetical protein H6Q00_631 [Holophagaceae bacterium]|nr:hypothetical protein [Holophagaceae bacterium]